MSKAKLAIIGGTSAAILLAVFCVRFSRRETPNTDPSVRRPLPQTRRIADNHWTVSILDKDAYLKNVTEATSQITLKPYPGKEPDSVADLSVMRIAEESPMYVAGFRQDDRILKVNGTPVATMSRAVNLIHEIKASNPITVQVRRGDQIIDYRFDFE